MFGRIGFGLAGDRFGARRVLVPGLPAQAFGVLAHAFVSRLGCFHAVAVVVGFIHAGPLPGGPIHDHFASHAPMHVGSWRMGLTAMLILLAFRPFPGAQRGVVAA